MAKIFVSHRTADAARAKKLTDDLAAPGHDVWLDEYEIGVGDSVTEQMNKGLTDADYVVLCYSKHGAEAPWIAREWLSALARQLDGCVNSRGNVIKILPVKLTKGEPPAILYDIKWLDLTKAKDWDKGVTALLAAIR